MVNNKNHLEVKLRVLKINDYLIVSFSFKKSAKLSLDRCTLINF